MDRRNFLRLMVGGVATAAAVRSFPFRVFSFPKESHVWTPKDLIMPPYSNAGLEEYIEWLTKLVGCICGTTSYHDMDHCYDKIAQLAIREQNARKLHQEFVNLAAVRHFRHEQTGIFG